MYLTMLNINIVKKIIIHVVIDFNENLLWMNFKKKMDS